MSRPTGWVILMVDSALIYSLAFSSYEAWTGSWRTTDSGGLVKITVDSPHVSPTLSSEPNRSAPKMRVCVSDRPGPLLLRPGLSLLGQFFSHGLR